MKRVISNFDEWGNSRRFDCVDKEDWEKACMLIDIQTGTASKMSSSYVLAFLTGWPRWRVEAALADAQQREMVAL